MKWHYQVVPGDIWDFDSVQQLMLADLTINGRPRKVIMQANKNGVLLRDRSRSPASSSRPARSRSVTWAKGIDPKTGRPIVNPEALLRHRADLDLARRRRRAQLVADVVQSGDRPRLHSDVDDEQLDLRGGADVQPAARP